MKFTALLLAALLILSPTGAALAQQQAAPATTAAAPDAAAEVAQAQVDAERDANTNISQALWFLGGVGCGIFAVAYALARQPTISPAAFVGKSPTYVATYTATYKAKARSRYLQSSCLGWAAWAIAVGVYYASEASE